MKVLMISPGMQTSQNSGVGSAAGNIAKWLSKGHELTIIQSNKTSSIESPKSQTELQEVFSTQSTVQDLVKSISSPLSVYGGTQEEKKETTESEIQNQLLSFTKEVVKEASNTAFDVIYAHDWISFKAGIELKKKLKKPLVLHVHSLDIDRISSTHHSWIYDEELQGFEAADAIITVSSYTASRLVRHYRIKPEKIHVVHNGIDLPKIKPAQKKRFQAPLVVFAGRLTEQKGVKTFLDIANEVLKAQPNVRFVLAGDGELKADLIEIVIRKQIGHRVHFTGHLSQAELWQLYAEADVFCLPSLSEPFGLATLEAAADGLPVVISKQSGVAEVLPQAMTPDHKDVSSFSEAILQLIKDEGMAKERGDKNKQAAAVLTWKAAAEKISKTLTAITS